MDLVADVNIYAYLSRVLYISKLEELQEMALFLEACWTMEMNRVVFVQQI